MICITRKSQSAADSRARLESAVQSGDEARHDGAACAACCMIETTKQVEQPAQFKNGNKYINVTWQQTHTQYYWQQQLQQQQNCNGHNHIKILPSFDVAQ